MLAEKIAKYIEIDVIQHKFSISLNQFIDIIEKQPWADEVIKDKHIKFPVILIIDDQLIQISNNNENVTITESSDINFSIMFAGG